MKKNLRFFAGIVFLFAILVVASCNQKPGKEAPEPEEKVKIYLKAIEEDGIIRLQMYDSNKPGDKVTDELETFVDPGSTVLWKRTLFSGIRKIVRIGSKSGEGNIFIGDAQHISDKRLKLEIPEDVSSGEEEAYYIIFIDTEGDTTKIDPYLKIR